MCKNHHVDRHAVPCMPRAVTANAVGMHTAPSRMNASTKISEGVAIGSHAAEANAVGMHTAPIRMNASTKISKGVAIGSHAVEAASKQHEPGRLSSLQPVDGRVVHIDMQKQAMQLSNPLQCSCAAHQMQRMATSPLLSARKTLATLHNELVAPALQCQPSSLGEAAHAVKIVRSEFQ